MPKIDFNVPVLQQDGNPQMRAKVDHAKIKMYAQGRPESLPVMDADGFVVQETLMLRELLSNLINQIFIGEESIGHDERLARGKLSRKIMDGTESSCKNYSFDEIKIIKNALIKSQTPPLILAQVDEVIESGKWTKEELAEKNAPSDTEEKPTAN